MTYFISVNTKDITGKYMIRFSSLPSKNNTVPQEMIIIYNLCTK